MKDAISTSRHVFHHNLRENAGCKVDLRDVKTEYNKISKQAAQHGEEEDDKSTRYMSRIQNY